MRFRWCKKINRPILGGLLCCLLLLAPSVAAEVATLRLATTTSVENSGLLNYLLGGFEQQCGCRVHVLPVGSGRALEMGRRGDVDVLITHAPPAEEKFIKDGFGVARHPFMFNSFLLLGPDSLPDISNKTIEHAMLAIADTARLFVSRGDDSGTHKKERQLWRRIEAQLGRQLTFNPQWYIEAGVGMGQALLMADELRAFVLTDKGTYLFFRDKLNLQVVVQNTPPLLNFYSVVLVNPARHPHIEHQLAQQFARWLTATTTQQKIADYRLLGESLFQVESRAGSSTHD